MTHKLKYFLKSNLIAIYFLLFAINALSATPVLFFSDMTDGPVTGWEQSETKGAAVSVWGLNFGSAVATSKVTCGGQDIVANTAGIAEWAATTNPITARGLQRITFYLNSSMITTGDAPNTTISVTTSEGTSNSIDFHCRAIGSTHIYFVSTSGNDSNTGLSTSAQWLTFQKAREEVDAGDVVYFRAGTFTAEDEYGNGSVLTLRTVAGIENHNNGTAYNSITFAAYPGEVAQIGDGLNTTTTSAIKRQYNTNVSVVSYWTFSKFKIYTYSTAIAYSSGNSIIEDNYVRYVGMDGTTTQASLGSGITINPYGDITGMKLLGCYLHHSGRGAAPTSEYGYKVEPLYFGGGGQSSDLEVAYNDFYNNNGTVQFYAHNAADTLTGLKFHHNFVTYAGTNTGVFGGGDPAASDYNFIVSADIYNNIFAYNQGGFLLLGNYQDRGGAFKVYNNVFYNNCLGAGSTRELNIFNVTSLDFKNNIIYAGDGSDSGYYTDFNGAGSTTTTGMVGSYNCWYGQGDGPDWSSTDLDDTDPVFADSTPEATTEYSLGSGSPCIDAGYDVSSVVSTDFLGLTRADPLDIGAFLYGSETPAATRHCSGSFSGG